MLFSDGLVVLVLRGSVAIIIFAQGSNRGKLLRRHDCLRLVLAYWSEFAASRLGRERQRLFALRLSLEQALLFQVRCAHTLSSWHEREFGLVTLIMSLGRLNAALAPLPGCIRSLRLRLEY